MNVDGHLHDEPSGNLVWSEQGRGCQRLGGSV
jgi:hypothetical protein